MAPCTPAFQLQLYSPGCNAGYNLLSINYQTNTGGHVTALINGSLPSGVSLQHQTGHLWNIDGARLQPPTWWANNSGGSTVAYLNITVEDPADISIDPSSVTVTRGYDIAPITANNTGAEVLDSYFAGALSGSKTDGLRLPLVNMSATMPRLRHNSADQRRRR